MYMHMFIRLQECVFHLIDKRKENNEQIDEIENEFQLYLISFSFSSKQ